MVLTTHSDVNGENSGAIVGYHAEIVQREVKLICVRMVSFLYTIPWPMYDHTTGMANDTKSALLSSNRDLPASDNNVTERL